MKLLFTSLVLVILSSNSLFAADTTVDCKDRRGEVLPKTLESLNKIKNSKSNRPQVFVEGTISQILPEDKAGLPHQKYVLKAFNSVKLVIVSNVDFGRIPLQVGTTVSVCGEYLNAEGGMVHWTHFDPHGGHPDGFTILNGKLYGDKEQN